MYCRPEDEFYHKHSFLSYSFPSEKLVATDELQPRRLVMLLTMEHIKKARLEYVHSVNVRGVPEKYMLFLIQFCMIWSPVSCPQLDFALYDTSVSEKPERSVAGLDDCIC